MMRKYLGGFLGLVAALFLGLAYAQMARADEPEKTQAKIECKDALANKIAELVASDKSGILKLQLKLTTLKLAAETVRAKSKTVEGYVKKQEAELKQLDTDEFMKKAVSVYKKYGEKGTDDGIIAVYNETKEKLKNGSYRHAVTDSAKHGTRFTNKDLTAFVQASIDLNGSGKPYSAEDATALWIQSEISQAIEDKTYRGSAAANIQEVSTQIAKMAGFISKADGKTAEQLDAEVIGAQKEVTAEYDRIIKEFAEDLKKSCVDLVACPKCDADKVAANVSDVDKKSGLMLGLDLVMKKMQADDKMKSQKIDTVIAEMKTNGIELDVEVGDALTGRDQTGSIKAANKDEEKADKAEKAAKKNAAAEQKKKDKEEEDKLSAEIDRDGLTGGNIKAAQKDEAAQAKKNSLEKLKVKQSPKNRNPAPTGNGVDVFTFGTNSANSFNRAPAKDVKIPFVAEAPKEMVAKNVKKKNAASGLNDTGLEDETKDSVGIIPTALSSKDGLSAADVERRMKIEDERNIQKETSLVTPISPKSFEDLKKSGGKRYLTPEKGVKVGACSVVAILTCTNGACVDKIIAINADKKTLPLRLNIPEGTASKFQSGYDVLSYYRAESSFFEHCATQ